MTKDNNNTTLFKSKLYNKIVELSRNKLLYSKFRLNDSFQNRIYLIFIHLSFLLVRFKKNKQKPFLSLFNQNIFDYTFYKIELNMREIGYGDIAVNKNMKMLVKDFYNILFFCEKYKDKTLENKTSFIKKYLSLNNTKNIDKNDGFIIYLDKYHAFCLDLSSDNVLKGELNYNYI